MKTKKHIAFLLCFALVLSFLTMQLSVDIAKAAELDEADRCLIETMEITFGDEMEITELSYSRQEIYNNNLQAFGYAYSLSCSGLKGFALMINLGLYYEVTEIFFNKIMPYDNISGIPVYITPMSYIEYIDGDFYDIESENLLDEDDILYLTERGFGYKGGFPSYTDIQYVTYTSKSEETYRIPGTFPAYYNVNSNFPNTCAVTAGATVIGYWGRYFPQLVPNHTVGRMLGSSYYYNPQSSAVQVMVEDLYYRMGTNVGGDGTTAVGCRNGIKSYVENKNLNVTYSSVVSNHTLNLTSYMNHLQNLKPILLFFNTYNIIGENAITTQGNTDTIIIDYHSGMHVMVSFGYKFVKYYNGSHNFRTDYFIRVFTGFADIKFGYVKLYDGAIMQEGYAVHIY